MKANFTIRGDFFMGLVSVIGLLVWYGLCLPVTVTLTGQVIRNNWLTMADYRRSRDSSVLDISTPHRRDSGHYLLSLFSLCAVYNAFLAFGWVDDYTTAYALLLVAVPLVILVNAGVARISEGTFNHQAFLISLETLTVFSLPIVMLPFALQNANLGVPEVLLPFAMYNGTAVIASLFVIPAVCLNREYFLSSLTFLAAGMALFPLLPLEPAWGLALSCACGLVCHVVLNGVLYRRCLAATGERNRFAVVRKAGESPALQLAALSRHVILIGFLAAAFIVTGFALDGAQPFLPWGAVRNLPQGKTIPYYAIHYAAPVLALPLLVVSLLQAGRLFADARRIRRLKKEKVKLCRELGVVVRDLAFNAEQKIVSVSDTLRQKIVSTGDLDLALKIAGHLADWLPWLNMFIVNRFLSSGGTGREAAPFYLEHVEHFLAPYARGKGQPLSKGGQEKLVDGLFFNASGVFPGYEFDRARILLLLHECDPYRDCVGERYFEILGAFLENGSIPSSRGRAHRSSVGKILALVKQGKLPRTLDDCCAQFANAAGRGVLEELYALCGFHLGINLFLLLTDRAAPAASGYAGDFCAQGLTSFLTFASAQMKDKLRPYLLKDGRSACPFKVAPDKLIVFLKDVYRYRDWLQGTALELCARTMASLPEAAFESAIWNKGHTFESCYLFLCVAQAVPGGLYETHFQGVRRETDLYTHEMLANKEGQKLVDLYYLAKVCLEGERKEGRQHAES